MMTLRADNIEESTVSERVTSKFTLMPPAVLLGE